MAVDRIAALYYGAHAGRLLGMEPAGQVMGVTSRGVFLHLDNEWMIFLSTEKWPGPLTINLRGGDGFLQRLSKGTLVKVHSQAIDFGDQGLTIDLSLSQPWRPSPISAMALPIQERKRLFTAIIRNLMLEKTDHRLKDIGSLLQGRESGTYLVENHLAVSFSKLVKLFQQERREEIPSASAALLGSGDGLTPAGDDLVLGLGLALKRWGKILAPRLDAESILVSLPGAARQRTTMLSANLIECAVQGEADERLVSALDGILTGRPGVPEIVSGLADWGSSSGGYVLCGIGAVLAVGV